MANILRALRRARLPLLTVAITYALSVTFGAVLVHTGNAFALGQYDSLMGRVNATTDPTLKALSQGNRLQAALYDFSGNLLLGALPGTVAGVCVICFYPIAAYRGWIGGIVSVDGAHASRLADPREAAYYLITLVLQLIPYTLAGAAGVNLGLALLRPADYYSREKWWLLPKEAVRDAARLYVLVVPLFAVASLWEFLAR